MTQTSRFRHRHRLRAAAAIVALALLTACAGWPGGDDSPDSGDLLENSLPVAGAALAAGQVDVARRLYLSLAERFDEAPEPLLGLAYIAFQERDHVTAGKYFLQASELAEDQPAIRAEALLGAGRAALARGRTSSALQLFRDAREPGQATPAAPWIENGLAVTSALNGDYEAAEAHYLEALRQSGGHPRITANFVRMLSGAGRLDEAEARYAEHEPSFWEDDDGRTLHRLLEESRRERQARTVPEADGISPETAPDESRAGGGTEHGGIEPDASSFPGPTDSRTLRWSELPDPSPPPRRMDVNLALRLSPALPEETALREEIRSVERTALPNGSPLTLRLAGWSDSQPTASAADDAQAAMMDASVAARPAATDAGSSETAAQSPDTPESIAGPTVVPAPESHSTAQRPEAPAPERQGTVDGVNPPASPSRPIAPEPDGTVTASGAAAPQSRTTPATAAVAPGPARPFPLSEPEMSGATPIDHSPATTLTLFLGQSSRMHLNRDAASVLVASPDIADVQLLAPNVLYVIGRAIGRTTVAVLDDNDWLEEHVVSVVLDMEPLRTILGSEPDLAGVRAQRLPRGVALTGDVASAAAADRAVRLAAAALPGDVSIENEMRVAGPLQVNLEVQIAEVRRSVTESLGVNWEAFRIRNNEGFGFRIGRLVGFPLRMNPNNQFPGHFPGATIGGRQSPGAYFGQTTGRTRIGAMIDALSTAGLANVLARPNVTAVSGESASFFSGGERPIPAGYDRDTNTILYEYKKVGVLLDFVPTVVETGRIVLKVRPEVSEPDASQPLVIGPVSLPVINVRRAETTVDVADGESIVIAGLFRNQSSTEESGVTGLKDVPLLGVLFGHTATRSDELELIVIVTARLVEPNRPSEETGPSAALRVSGYHY